MIAIGGIVGAGLFVGSSAAIAASWARHSHHLCADRLPRPADHANAGRDGGRHAAGTLVHRVRPCGARNWAGFSVGWLYWFFWVVVVPVEAMPAPRSSRNGSRLPTWQIGVALMAVMTAVNMLSARAYGEFEFWFSSIKVTAIVAFILVAAAHAFGLVSPAGRDSRTWSLTAVSRRTAGSRHWPR